MGSCLSDKEKEDKLKIAKKEALKNKSSNVTKSINENQTDLNQQKSGTKNTIEDFFIKSKNLTKNDFPIYPEKFKEFECYDDEIYIGEGVQKDKAYKSNLYIDNLIELRSTFWNFINDIAKISIDFSKFVKNVKNACMVDSGKFF